MREILSMIVVLSVICGVSGLTLSYLKISTAPLIEEQVLTYVQSPALTSVFPDPSNNPISERQKFEYNGREITVFPAKKDGKLTGVAFETFAGGYGGDIGVMVGFDLNNDQLAGIGITTLKETPGLGMRITEVGYTKQFAGADPAKVNLSSQGGSVDAVSGATISSVGTINAVHQAAEIYTALKDKFIQTFEKS